MAKITNINSSDSTMKLTQKLHRNKSELDAFDYNCCCDYADVELCASSGGPLFPANSIILAAWSPVLHEILIELSSVSVVGRPLIIFDDITSDTIQQLLVFLYCGSIDKDKSSGSGSINNQRSTVENEVASALRLLSVSSVGPTLQDFGLSPRVTPASGAEQKSLDQVRIKTEQSEEVRVHAGERQDGNTHTAECNRSLIPAGPIGEREFSRECVQDNNFSRLKDQCVADLCRTLIGAFGDAKSEKLSETSVLPTSCENKALVVRCKFCGAKFSDRSSLRRHRKSVHSRIASHRVKNRVKPAQNNSKAMRTVQCNQCHLAFTSTVKLNSHLRKVHNCLKENGNHVDAQDDNDSASNAAEDRTETDDRTEITGGGSSVKCDICFKTVKQRYLLKHKQTHKQFTPFHCSICNKCFNRKDRFEQHQLTHTSNPLKCNKCDKTFSYRQNMASHCCGDKQKPYNCSVCHKGFQGKRMYEEHTRLHTGKDLFECEHCHKTFCYESSYKLHLQIHEGIKKWVCQFCGSAFLQQGNLKNHLLIHTSGGLPKKFTCDVCGLACHSQSAMVKHTRTHTGEKPFCCDICGKSFATRGYLKTHMLFHGDKKQFVCNYCGKSFFTDRHLQDHIRTHTGEKPFSCSSCTKMFSSRSLLAIHRRSHKEKVPRTTTTTAATDDVKSSDDDKSIVNSIRKPKVNSSQTTSQASTAALAIDSLTGLPSQDNEKVAEKLLTQYQFSANAVALQ